MSDFQFRLSNSTQTYNEYLLTIIELRITRDIKTKIQRDFLQVRMSLHDIKYALVKIITFRFTSAYEIV